MVAILCPSFPISTLTRLQDRAPGAHSRSVTSLLIRDNTSPNSNSRNATPQLLPIRKRRILSLGGFRIGRVDLVGLNRAQMVVVYEAYQRS
jgi:hypothetical protein